MSFLLAGLIVAGTSGAIAVGRWLSRRRDDQAPDGPKPPPGDATDGDGASKKDKDANADEASKKPASKRPPRKVDGPHAHLEGFPCQLGDVIMRLTGEEAWLAGGVVLSEEAPIAALFVAPDAGHDCAIYVRPRPREAVYWMEPLDPGAVEDGSVGARSRVVHDPPRVGRPDAGVGEQVAVGGGGDLAFGHGDGAGAIERRCGHDRGLSRT